MKTKTEKTPLLISEAFGPASCSFGFVPESKLSHKPEAQSGLVPRLRNQGGKNSKNTFLLSTIDATVNRGGRFGLQACVFKVWNKPLFLLFSGCNPIGVDVVDGGFYLGACTQGKAYRYNIKDEVLTWKKGFYGFLLN